MLQALIHKISVWSRARRAKQLRAMIEEMARRNGRCAILDLGGRVDYWLDLGFEPLRSLGVSVTIVNNFAGDGDGPRTPPVPGIEVIEGDACDLSGFDDGRFDLVHSNSCIEHVGDWSRMQAFAREARRLAPAYYVQTPDFWFPIEPHFLAFGFHWLPERERVRRLMRRGYGHHPRQSTEAGALSVVRSARLLTRRKLKALFPDADLSSERIAGLPKSLIAVRRPG